MAELSIVKLMISNSLDVRMIAGGGVIASVR